MSTDFAPSSPAIWNEKAPPDTQFKAPPAAAVPPPSTAPIGAGPGVSTDVMARATEVTSQKALDIPTQDALLTTIKTQPGADQLSQSQVGDLVSTWTKTRQSHGLPAMAQPVSPQVQAALPPSVTGQPSAAPAGAPQAGAPTARGPVPPPAAPGLKAVPGQDAVPQQTAPTPTAQYQAPPLESPTYTAPKEQSAQYKAPNKGLQYAAAAISLLFPGSQIARAAGGFSEGLTQGADAKFKRASDAAHEANRVAEANAGHQFEADRDKDNATNQTRLAQAQGNFTSAQLADKTAAARATTDYNNQVSIYNDRQSKRAQGMNPDTGKAFQLPPALSKTPDPSLGYDGLAKWHQARALAYTQLGATGPASQEDAAAKSATTQATNAANNARSLIEANARMRNEWAIHSDTESNENARHNDTVDHEDRRALLADQGRRAEYGTKASAADKSLYTTWQQYTKPQTKIVEVKDPATGQVTATHAVPLVDDKGQAVLAPISGDLQKSLTKMVNAVRQDRDPQGAAAYYAAHLDNTPGGLAGQEILQQAGEASSLRMYANGRVPEPHSFPKIAEAKTPAGVNLKDPKVVAWREEASSAGIDPDSAEAIAAMNKDLGAGAHVAPAIPGREQSHRIAAAAAAPVVGPPAPVNTGWDQRFHHQ